MDYISRLAQATQYYKPRHIRLCFLAEAPPQYDELHPRFFYFEDVYKADALFWELMKALSDHCPRSINAQVRRQKTEYLDRFKEDGYFLLDCVPYPLPDDYHSTGMKERYFRERRQEIVENIGKQIPKDTPLVLLSAPVYKVFAEALKEAGFQVLNTEVIPFPGSGQQGVFHKRLREVLNHAGL